MVEFTVRKAMLSDVDVLARLIAQLGYPATADDVRRRLATVEGRDDLVALVAEIDGAAGGETAGLATAQMTPLLFVEAPRVMLTALVVDERRRGFGIGRALVDAIEAWGTERGALRLVVDSGVARAEAHAFYEHLGYANTAKRFSRILRTPPDPNVKV